MTQLVVANPEKGRTADADTAVTGDDLPGGNRPLGRPAPEFLAHLIAARLRVPQQREWRRAPPETATAHYRDVQTAGFQPKQTVPRRRITL